MPLCICVCLCWNLLILSAVGGWVTGPGRRSGRKESQYGILIRTGKKRWQPACWCERCVCLTMFALCTRACMLPSPPDFWESHLGNVDKDKRRGGIEHAISPPKKRVWRKKWICAHWKLLFQLYPIRLELRQSKSFNAIELPALFLVWHTLVPLDWVTDSHFRTKNLKC